MSPANNPKKPFHVAVCGGGIGGLCTVIGLLHQGISCTVYEAASAFAEIGAGVSFGPNALRAMILLDPAIEAGFQKIATPNGWTEKRKVWFDFHQAMKEETWAKEGVEGMKEGKKIATVIAKPNGQDSVHRAHFLDVLVQMVPDGIAKFGKRVENVESVGEKMVLTFGDGTKDEADAVIGCDGVKSRTRQILIGDGFGPRFTHKYAYRGLIPMDKAVEALGDDLGRNSHMHLGHHGHVLTFPIENGKTMNVVAFQSKTGEWEDERWVLPMKKEDMFRDFAGWGESVQKILSLMEKPDVWALFEHPPAPTYYKDRLAILGDAAHASTPHQGAGAGQAIEDAYVLTHLLGQANSVNEIEDAFRAYDAVRRPRSQKVVTTSREAGILYDFEDESVNNNLEIAKEKLEIRCKWIWDEDLPQQLKKALDIMVAKANL